MTRNIKGRLRRIEAARHQGRRTLVFISEWPDGVFHCNCKTYRSMESAQRDNGAGPGTIFVHANVPEPMPLPPAIAAARAARLAEREQAIRPGD